jgi:hypothetical protein
MALSGDPELLKACAEIVNRQKLDTTPQAYLRAMLEKHKDDFLDANKSAPSTSTMTAPSAAVAAYRAKLSNGSA